MNKQTRLYRKSNLSTKVVKHTAVPKAPPRVMGTALTEVEYDSTKGHEVDSSKLRAAQKNGKGEPRKPWKGHGDPLGRNKR